MREMDPVELGDQDFTTPVCLVHVLDKGDNTVNLGL